MTDRITEPYRITCAKCGHTQILTPSGENKTWMYHFEDNRIRWQCDECGQIQPLTEPDPAPEDRGEKGPGLEVVSNSHPAARQQEVVNRLTNLVRLADAGEAVGYAMVVVRPNGSVWHDWDTAQAHTERAFAHVHLLADAMSDTLRERTEEVDLLDDDPA